MAHERYVQICAKDRLIVYDGFVCTIRWSPENGLDKIPPTFYYSGENVYLLTPLMRRPSYDYQSFWWPSACCKNITKEEAEQLLIAYELQR